MMKVRDFIAVILLICSVPVEAAQRYLLSIVNLPMKDSERLERFKFATWGMEFHALCSIPPGWRITIGSSASPDGTLSGESSQGVTWLGDRNPPELHNFALVSFKEYFRGVAMRHGAEPTFRGSAKLSTAANERVVALTDRQIRVTKAKECSVRAATH